MRRFTIVATWLVLAATQSFAQKSPDGKLRVIQQENSLLVKYRSASGWQNIYSADVNVSKCAGKRKFVEQYDMLLGKQSHISKKCVEAIYYLTDGGNLFVRIFNNGVAFRKVKPDGCQSTATPDGRKTDVKSEVPVNINFSYAQNYWLMKWTDSYEEFFPKNRSYKTGDRFGYPSLFEYKDAVFALLSESDIHEDNAASCLYATDAPGIFRIQPDFNDLQPKQSPWHAVIIGNLDDIVSSTLITDLATPQKLAYTEWIQPGVASWVYWANNHGSNDYNIIKKYVDMAVEMKLPYVLIDAEWDEMPKLASNEGKTIEDAVRYATEHGVKPMIWYNSSVGWINGAPGPKFRLNKPEDREREFAWCEKIGVKGVKIDFFSGDNNMNIKYMTDLLECAAKHHLLVNFHGATTMRGWQRTYPNLISAEAVYGAEWYNNVPTFTDKAASHNAMLPFTRNVLGSMDYTPCAFTDSQHPHITTHAHELALTVLFESGIQHLADRPESFLSQEKRIRDFLTELPTTWDETRYISGYPGESVVLARRKGGVWYVAGINGTDEEKALDVSALNKFIPKDVIVGMYKDNTHQTDKWGDSPFATYTYDMKMGPLDVEICKPRGGFVYKIQLPEDKE